MLKLTLFLLLLTEAAFAQKLSMDSRRKQILAIVDQELAEVSRLAKQENFSSPDTLLRLSELNLEKARLWRETENEQYLSIPAEERRGIKKNDYFKNSTRFFELANDSAETVVKRFPRYNGIGEVYYILAYNNKELGNNDLAQKYFKLASGKSDPSSKIKIKSNIALADYYFNSHKYKEAIPLYESSLNKIDEQWWTKDAFNLAWCYYRTNLYDKAIGLMREVHRKSSGGKYVNMKDQVERDIGIFYVDAGKINDAVKFYNSIGINYTEQFVKIATSIINQGRFTQAESLLDQAEKFEKDRSRKIIIHLAQLDLFDKFNKVDQHLDVTQKLMKLHEEKPLDEDALKRLSYHVNKKAAELQKTTASDLYKNVPKVQQKKSSQAIAYFEISAKLNPKERAEKVFFQGETAYAAGDYQKALSHYINAFDYAKSNKEDKIITQSLEGMLSSLGQSSLNKDVAEKYYVPVYTRYLSHDSKSARANTIFVKLFNSQYDAGDMSSAEVTMARFAEKFPEDYKTQEGMLAKVMEHYRKKKDYGKVKSYVGDINAGKYKVSQKYADALRSLMTKIQIEGVQQSLERGEKDVALKGYHRIYESTDSTPKAKINASYNLSALYYEMGNTNQSYQWGVTALRDMDEEDVVKFADSYLSIAAGLFLRQQFDQSADMSYRVLAKICKKDSSNKVVAYKNAVFIALANGDLDKALEIKEFGKACLIQDSTVTEVTLELVKELARMKRWEIIESQLAELEKNPKNFPLLIKPYEDLRKVYVNIADHERSQEISSKQERFFNTARNQKLEIPVEALDLMAFKMLAPISEQKQKLDQMQLQFPEMEFNKTVKLKLQILDQMTTQVNAIQKLGSGKGIVEAYKYVIAAYENFGQSLKSFVPEGKSPEYIASFQKAMSDVYNPILANARKQRVEIKKLILDNKILSLSNYDVVLHPEESFKRYVSPKRAVLMERGGQK